MNNTVRNKALDTTKHHTSCICIVSFCCFLPRHTIHLLPGCLLVPFGSFTTEECLLVYLPQRSRCDVLMALTGRASKGVALPYLSNNLCTMCMKNCKWKPYNLTRGRISSGNNLHSPSCRTVGYNAQIKKINTANCTAVINAHLWLCFSPFSYHAQFAFLHHVCCTAWKNLLSLHFRAICFLLKETTTSAFFNFLSMMSVWSPFPLNLTVSTASVSRPFSTPNSYGLLQ